MNQQLKDLICTLRQEADEQEKTSRRIDKRGVPGYNPIQWGRAESKRDAATRIEQIIKGKSND